MMLGGMALSIPRGTGQEANIYDRFMVLGGWKDAYRRIGLV